MYIKNFLSPSKGWLSVYFLIISKIFILVTSMFIGTVYLSLLIK